MNTNDAVVHILQHTFCLFQQNDQVTFDYFRVWVKAHPDATEMTKWLLMEPMTVSLSDDTDTPTFYQTLAGVTHCEYKYLDDVTSNLNVFYIFCLKDIKSNCS